MKKNGFYNPQPQNKKTDRILRITIVVLAVLLILTVITIAIVTNRLNSFPQR